jgi:hypothetical protein
MRFSRLLCPTCCGTLWGPKWHGGSPTGLCIFTANRRAGALRRESRRRTIILPNVNNSVSRQGCVRVRRRRGRLRRLFIGERVPGHCASARHGNSRAKRDQHGAKGEQRTEGFEQKAKTGHIGVSGLWLNKLWRIKHLCTHCGVRCNDCPSQISQPPNAWTPSLATSYNDCCLARAMR